MAQNTDEKSPLKAGIEEGNTRTVIQRNSGVTSVRLGVREVTWSFFDMVKNQNN